MAQRIETGHSGHLLWLLSLVPRVTAVTAQCRAVKRCVLYIQGGPKNGATLIAIILSNLNRFNFFSLEDSTVFAIKRILKIPPHLTYVATLPCETLMSAKQALNDKLQGSVAAYLRCGGVVNNQIKKGLLLSE